MYGSSTYLAGPQLYLLVVLKIAPTLQFCYKDWPGLNSAVYSGETCLGQKSMRLDDLSPRWGLTKVSIARLHSGKTGYAKLNLVRLVSCSDSDTSRISR